MQELLQMPCPCPEQGKEQSFSSNQFPGLGRILPGISVHPGSLLGNADILNNQSHRTHLHYPGTHHLMQALNTRMSKQVVSKI